MTYEREPRTDTSDSAAEDRRLALRRALQLWAAAQDRAPLSPVELQEHAPPWYLELTRDVCPR